MSNTTGEVSAAAEDEQLLDILSAAMTIARGAGAILSEGIAVIRADRGAHLQFKTSEIDPVTEYDVRSEKYIVGELQKLFPSHHIAGEEGGSYGAVTGQSANAHYQWHIDPLDGTVNFSHGFSIFCVSMGLVIDGAPSIGVVYSPMTGDMYAAARGHGATQNGAPIRVSSISTLKRALLLTGFPYDSHTSDSNVPEFLGFQRTAQATRRIGSAALDLCFVASGQMDGYWESKIKPHDIAAGIVLVREAGGIVTDHAGGDDMLKSGKICASNGLIHPEMLAVLKQSQS